MLNYFIFNGIDSRDHGVWILEKNSFDSPKRNLSFISVPGRDGDIVIDNGNYNNITVEYKIRISADNLGLNNQNYDLAYQLDDIKDWLYSTIGNYAELEDSYNPDYFRRACFVDGLDFSTKHKNSNFIDSSITFECKPYRYKQDGKNVIAISDNNAHFIFNPELYTALPLIQIYKGSSDAARLVINGSYYDFDFTDLSISNIIIDSENQLVYNLNTNYYNKYSPPSTQLFPILKKGETTVQKVTGTGTVLITPRWRRI